MRIHVVEAGQTLSAIGALYGLSPGLIARWNGLRFPYSLAVGQALVVLEPAGLYTVREGDTLLGIAAKYNTTVLSLMRDNPNLNGLTEVFPGQVLVTGLAETRTREICVSGYAYPFVNQSVLRGILPYASCLMPFTYGITAGGGGLVPLDDTVLVRLAKEYAARPVLHLSTLTENGGFSSDRAAAILRVPEAQTLFAAAVIARMQAGGYEGVDVDFEYLEGDLAEAYAEFLGRLHALLQPLGYPLLAALAPKTSANQPGLLYEGHNYKLIAENCDAVLLMTYEWGYTYGPPMAVAPLDAVRRVLDYAVTEIPADKILLGIPNYGYDWTLPFVQGTSRARLISNEEAVSLALRYRADIQFDETAMSPYLYYTDEHSRVHEVWFEDARSMRAKMGLISEYGFRGAGFWNFMRSFVSGFSVLNAMYTVEKQGLGTF